MRENIKKVAVAISGGIDSSVAAALLKRKRFKVVGVFIKFWTESKKECQKLELRAKKIASILKIPLYIFNFEKEFKKEVVDYFLEASQLNLTPNPCVVCNKKIKFGLFLKKCLSLNINFIATGHYARKLKSKRSYKLLRAKDKRKDQSYFLWQLTQKELRHILFPIGDYSRTQVESLAKKFKLPVEVKKSQDICFVQGGIERFLKKYIGEKPGEIVDKKGKVLGEHQGLFLYTVGQRKKIRSPQGPYYVLKKDFRKNRLIVTKNDKDLYKKELVAGNINWISEVTPKLPLIVEAKIRYRHPLAKAIIKPIKGSKDLKVIFEKPQKAITPGQSVVFYSKEEVLGGGIIESYE